MGVVLGRRGAGSDRAFDNKVGRAEAAGKNGVLRRREADLKAV